MPKKAIFFLDRHFHGLDGFCDVKFESDPVDDPANPIIRQEHAAVAITRMVKQYPSINQAKIYVGTVE